MIIRIGGSVAALWLLAASSVWGQATGAAAGSLASPDRPERAFRIDTRGFQAVPYSHADFADDPDDFQFVIVSDNTNGQRPGVFESAIRKINLLQPELVISIGDMIEGYTHDPETIRAQWSAFNGLVDGLEAPFFYLPGNHDWSNPTMARFWTQERGASYYHFVYKNVLFLILNTEEALAGVMQPGLTDAQYAYAGRVLDQNPDVRWTLVLMHQPLWTFDQAPNWTALQERLDRRNYTAFAGHLHTYDHRISPEGRDQITLGTTGGASHLRGKAYGEFDHVVWATIRDGGPVLANLSLDGIDDKYITSPAFDAAFEAAPAFRPVPWYSEADPEIGETHPLSVAVSNPFEGPLTYRISLEADPAYRFSPARVTGVLEPGASRTETFQATLLDRPTSPVEITAHGTVPLENGNRAEWSTIHRLSPVRRQSVSRAQRPVAIDGDLSDWPGLRFDAAPRDGGSDGGFRFDAAYDDAFLHVGVDVVDGEVTRAAGREGVDYSVDLLGVQFDGRPADISAGNIGNVVGLKHGEWLLMALMPDGEAGVTPFPELLPQGYRSAFRPTPTGYSAEFALPISYLNQRYGADWRDFRLNVFVNDVDPSTERPGRRNAWGPNWAQNTYGSGIFEKR